MKIVSVDKVYLDPKHIRELKKLGDVVIYNDVPDEIEGIKRIKDADIVIDNWFEMPATVISAAPKLKLIAVAATGYDWIDISAAKKHNIVVCNAPGYSTGSVAEHTIGLLLRAIRLASRAEADLRAGKWNPTTYKGKELSGKTLGIIGYGAIGKRVAKIAKNGFGMRILYVNSKNSRQDIEDLLKKSDVVSINAPLTNETRGMIGTKEFQLMNSGVVIINTGRGAIIDEQSLIDTLKSGKIFAAGLDTYVDEPMRKDNPLFTFSNVTLTPHIAFNTEESEQRLSAIVTKNIVAYLANHPQHVVSA
ncbi:MAG: NAD(P)-dependent oxidoreductase [Patescibacteria group bacterium]